MLVDAGAAGAAGAADGGGVLNGSTKLLVAGEGAPRRLGRGADVVDAAPLVAVVPPAAVLGSVLEGRLVPASPELSSGTVESLLRAGVAALP